MTDKLTAQTVQDIMQDCLFRAEEIEDGKPPENTVYVEGVVRNWGLHPERLEKNRDKIAELLNELPALAHVHTASKGGGGMSFLALCQDKHGNQWGEHHHVEALFALGAGLKMAGFTVTRPYWAMLPGAMPYIRFDTSGIEVPEPAKSLNEAAGH